MGSKIGLLSSVAALVLQHYFSWMVVLNSPLQGLSAGSCSTSVTGLFLLGGFSHDVGENNYLNTTAKGNQPFNGIDFPGAVATGRFSNGRNLADAVGLINVKDACCGNGTTPCTPTSSLCGNSTVRNRYLFWSQYIFTERTANLTAGFFAGGDYVDPISFPELAL
ncbi:GDSL esterase/lipase At5g55050 [Linum perenne]